MFSCSDAPLAGDEPDGQHEARLVVIDEQRGFSVAPVSLPELKDLTVARIALETSMLSLAIAQGDADWEAEIVAAFHRLSRTPLPSGAHSDEKARQWEQRHRAFHAALVAGCAAARRPG